MKVLVITGPTSTGKSDIAVLVAKKIGGEIISADSVQVFCGLNLLSGKITAEEMQNIPHHLIDICKPSKEFSASEHLTQTKNLIKEITIRGKVPIVVGGTGLYIKALDGNFSFGNTEKHEEFRSRLQKIANVQGSAFLHEMLYKICPQRANCISLNDEKRIIRALEIEEFGDNIIKTQLDENGKIKVADNKIEIKTVIIALDIPRQLLYEKINNRVDEMVKKGLLNEVKTLLDNGINENNQCTQAIGFKELIPYFNGEKSLDVCVEHIKQKSRNYAKRQLTLLRNMENVNFVDSQNKETAVLKIIEIFNQNK
ncbi:MAG: tRNA (adenosine(37)-N6)-dimethylallyltransferase MiaA [Clostridia bacterium]